ncbi:putative ATP-binding cassette transporter [Hyaloraphidium curvatum]|nr:putative ATP-binding cassette transporter [Hyaloraphidium curvatum]
MESATREGAAVRIGRLASWTEERPGAPLHLSWRHVSCTLAVHRKPKVLLDDVSGYCMAGEALAIVGPSGSGKSTLLDILARQKTRGKWTDDVRLNGTSLPSGQFVRTCGYVSDDLLTAEFTCEEMLSFVAALRLPEKSRAERATKVNDVLEAMSLWHCRKRRIESRFRRGLSTGERKRLTIAVELIPDLGALLLDEPTTGLDSATGLSVMANVIEIARIRRFACVASVHQPSTAILALFDRVLALSQGSVCYFGSVQDATAYFSELVPFS